MNARAAGRRVATLEKAAAQHQQRQRGGLCVFLYDDEGRYWQGDGQGGRRYFTREEIEALGPPDAPVILLPDNGRGDG